MDLDVALDLEDDGGDIGALVDSIYNDHQIFPGQLPDSPPDSGSEQLLSPVRSHGTPSDHPGGLSPPTGLPGSDLTSVDYTVPMQLLQEQEQLRDSGRTSTLTSTSVGTTSDIGGYHGGAVVVQPHQQQAISKSSSVEMPQSILSDALKGQQQGRFGALPTTTSTISEVMTKTKAAAATAARAKRKRKEAAPAAPSDVSTPPSAGEAIGGKMSGNIRFDTFEPHQCHRLASAGLVELASPRLAAVADKGFNFSSVDDAFIAQKKNHFQITCVVESSADVPLSDFHFVTTSAGLKEISYLEMNFYGVKQDVPGSCIKVEQSQADRSKLRFHPLRLCFRQGETCAKVSVGRLHFTETTANNMRKKGKPNPAQKYFQLVVSLEAVIYAGTPQQKSLPVCRLASERIVVRASNPGQFEPDTEGNWQRETGSDTLFHMGKVAINTDQAGEALSVHGNVQLTGQVLQPSDLRLKERLREVDPRQQLETVKQVKIMEFKYRKEYVDTLPEDQRRRVEGTPQTGVIAQDLKKILPEAVATSAESFTLANGNDIQDMLIVDKDRLFLENVGAVRELSKMTGHLEDRIGDLEKASESVAVRLSRLKRGASLSSVSTTSSSDKSTHKKKRSSSQSPALFQNKCAQAVALALMAIATVCLAVMAIAYIVNIYKGGIKETKSTTTILEEFITVNATENEIVPLDPYATQSLSKLRTLSVTTMLPSFGNFTNSGKATVSRSLTANVSATPKQTSVWLEQSSSSPPLTSSTTIVPSLPPPIIGASSECSFSGSCSSFCCLPPSSEDSTSQDNQTTVASANDAYDEDNLTSPGQNAVGDDELTNAIAESFEPDVLIVEPFAEEELLEPIGLVHAEVDNGDNFAKHDAKPEDSKTNPNGAERSFDQKSMFLEEEDRSSDQESQKVLVEIEASHADPQEESDDVKVAEEIPQEIYNDVPDKVAALTNEVSSTVPRRKSEDKDESEASKEDIIHKVERVSEDDKDSSNATEVNHITDSKNGVLNNLPLANEVADKVGNDLESNTREVRLLISDEEPLEIFSSVKAAEAEDIKTEIDDVTDINSIIEEEKAANATTTVALTALTEAIEEDKELNEIVKKDENIFTTSEKSLEKGVIGTSVQQERAKREVSRVGSSMGNMVKSIIRRIRNAEESDDLTPPILVTSVGNFTLDSRFCDPDHGCHGADHAINVTLAVPLSQFFGDKTVTVHFPPADNVTYQLCSPHVSNSRPCGPVSGEPVEEGDSAFTLDVRSNRESFLRVRRWQLRDLSPGVDLCRRTSFSPFFREYNIKFFRVCHA